MKKTKKILITLLILIGIVSCNKKYDEPILVNLSVGEIITIDSLKSLFGGQNMTISADLTLFANVTSEETNGNFYKEAYIQDSSGAILVKFKEGSGLYIGDSIQINITGCKLTKDYDYFQLEDVDPYLSVKKIATEKFITPDTISILDLNWEADQGKLICFKDVEFSGCEIGKTYADGFNLQNADRILIDEDGNFISVSSSGYANFADQTVDTGNGSIVCIVGEDYAGIIKFKIRDLNELQFNNSRNTPIAFLCKDFEDNDISSGGWTIQNVIGNINWVANDQFAQFGEYYGQISNYSNFSNTSCDTWLISPSVDLSAINSPRLSFFSAQNYSGPALEVYVSNDYDGLSNPSVNGTWNPIQVNLSNGNWNWIDSGPINLQQYKGENTYVAFRYQGSNSDGATWEIDDILISY